jgi:thioredoxin-like negative regulator of GroEL
MENIFLIFILLIINIKCSIVLYENDPFIIKLSKNNFNSYINSYKYILIHFYASWDNLSIDFNEKFLYLSKIYKNLIDFCVVDSDKETDLIKKLNVQTVPYFMFFIPSLKRPIHFNQDLNLVNLNHFILNNLNQFFTSQIINYNVRELNQNNFKQNVLDSLNYWIILFYNPDTSDSIDMLNKINIVSEKINKKIKFGKVNILKEKELKKKYNGESVPYIRVFLEGKKNELVIPFKYPFDKETLPNKSVDKIIKELELRLITRDGDL